MAAPNASLWRRGGNQMAHGMAVNVEAISPSHLDVQTFLKRIAVLPPIPPGSRLEPFDENDVAVALWVSVGNRRILLGADLEVCGAQRGWDAVLQSPAQLIGRASVFKIPHHGSPNADHAGVWQSLLDPNPMAALTTYNRGRKLPSADDVERILSRTPNAYVTSGLQRRASDQLHIVRKACRDFNIELHQRPKQVGHVRFRLRVARSGQWKCDLFEGARHVRDLEL